MQIYPQQPLPRKSGNIVLRREQLISILIQICDKRIIVRGEACIIQLFRNIGTVSGQYNKIGLISSRRHLAKQHIVSQIFDIIFNIHRRYTQFAAQFFYARRRLICSKQNVLRRHAPYTAHRLASETGSSLAGDDQSARLIAFFTVFTHSIHSFRNLFSSFVKPPFYRADTRPRFGCDRLAAFPVKIKHDKRPPITFRQSRQLAPHIVHLLAQYIIRFDAVIRHNAIRKIFDAGMLLPAQIIIKSPI